MHFPIPKNSKKNIKLPLIILACILGLLLIIGVLAPLLFKEDIKKAVDKGIASSINAEVIYDVNDISLSLISSFPNLRFGIDDLTVKNNAPFAGDTLANVESFEIYVNLWKLLSNEQIFVSKIGINAPYIHLKTTKNGIANFDIVKTDSTKAPEEPSDSPSTLNLALDAWEIKDARIYYEDSNANTYIHLNQFNQAGSASIVGDIINANVKTNCDDMSATYGKIAYLNKHHLASNINLTISEDYTRYELKENEVKINDFAMYIDGFFKMLDNHYSMDLSFATNENSFKNVLSLVPAVYTSDFDDIKTNGVFTFKASAKGDYDKRSGDIPAFDALLIAQDGYVVYPGVDLPVEKIMLDLKATNSGGKTENTMILLNKLSFTIADDPLSLKGSVHQLNEFSVKANGKLNLDNLKRAYPIEDMNIHGNLDFDIASTGKIKEINNGVYKNIKTNGNLNAKKIVIEKASMPDIKIDKAMLDFDAKRIELKDFNAQVGKSDFNLKGKVLDYMQYTFEDNGVLNGMFNLSSNTIDLNEWMQGDDSQEEVSSSEAKNTTSKAFAIPKNLNLKLETNINRIEMLDMPINNFSGNVDVKDGVVYLKNNKFQLLEGQFLTSGQYNTSDTNRPYFDLDSDIKDISVKKANAVFNSVKKLAPIAEYVSGKADASLKVTADIDGDYFPVYTTMNGKGSVSIARTGLQDFAPINNLSSLTGIKEFNNPQIEKTKLDFQIKNGKLVTEPFNIKVGKMQSVLNGSTSLDGDVNYNMKLNVPASEIGTLVKLLGIKDVDFINYESLGDLPLDVDFKGKYNAVKPSINTAMLTKTLKDKIVNQLVKDKVDKGKKIGEEAGKELLNNLVDPNDKRKPEEKAKDVIDKGAKKILDLFGPK